MTIFLAADITVPGKTANMAMVYGVVVLLSVLLVIAYLLWEKRRNSKFLLLFVCVAIVNCGYFLQSLSDTLTYALWANRISYFGAAYSMLIMLLITADVCRFPLGKKSVLLLICISTAAFFLAASGGWSGLYYEQVSISVINGMTRLVKVYGPLHFLYTVYLLLYFLLMAFFIFYAKSKRTIASTKYAVFLAAAVLGNLFVWAVEQLIYVDFEFLSVSYIATEVLLLLVYGLLKDYGIVENSGGMSELPFPAAENAAQAGDLPSDMEKIFEDFAVKLATLSGAEKRIFNYYLEGYEIADIPELAFVSIHTVKKHNRSIYQKLGISSRDELMLYIELFRRCGKLSDLK